MCLNDVLDNKYYMISKLMSDVSCNKCDSQFYLFKARKLLRTLVLENEPYCICGIRFFIETHNFFSELNPISKQDISIKMHIVLIFEFRQASFRYFKRKKLTITIFCFHSLRDMRIVFGGKTKCVIEISAAILPLFLNIQIA